MPRSENESSKILQRTHRETKNNFEWDLEGQLIHCKNYYNPKDL